MHFKSLLKGPLLTINSEGRSFMSHVKPQDIRRIFIQFEEGNTPKGSKIPLTQVIKELALSERPGLN